MKKLDKKIKEYNRLKKMRSQLDERISDLREHILKNVQHSYEGKGVKVTVQYKRRISYNESALMDLLDQKNALEYCLDTKINEDRVEELYYDGTLSDNDLRHIKEEKIIPTVLEEVKDV